MSDKLVRIKNRYDTAINWYNNNPILAAGEIGIDSTNNIMKVGNGSSNWNDIVAINDDIPTYILDSTSDEMTEFDSDGRIGSNAIRNAFFKNFGKKSNSKYKDIRKIIVIPRFDIDTANWYGNSSGSISFLNDKIEDVYNMHTYDPFCSVRIPIVVTNGVLKSIDYSCFGFTEAVLNVIKDRLMIIGNYLIYGTYHPSSIELYNDSSGLVGTVSIENGNIVINKITNKNVLSGTHTLYVGNAPGESFDDGIGNIHLFKSYIAGNNTGKTISPRSQYSPKYFDDDYIFSDMYYSLEPGVNIVCVNNLGFYEVNEYNSLSKYGFQYNDVLYKITKSIESLNKSNENASKTFYKQCKLTSDIESSFIKTNDDGTQVLRYPIAYLDSGYLNSDVDITGKQYMIKIDINGYNQVTIYSNSSDVNEKHYFYSLTDANASNVTDNYIELCTSGEITLYWTYTNENTINININITVGNNILLPN